MSDDVDPYIPTDVNQMPQIESAPTIDLKIAQKPKGKIDIDETTEAQFDFREYSICIL